MEETARAGYHGPNLSGTPLKNPQLTSNFPFPSGYFESSRTISGYLSVG